MKKAKSSQLLTKNQANTCNSQVQLNHPKAKNKDLSIKIDDDLNKRDERLKSC